MYTLHRILFALALCGSATLSDAQSNVINIDVASHGADISPSMYGVFFEEINHAGDGGLYAELVQNRSFEDSNILPGYHVVKRSLVSPVGTNHLTGQHYTKSHPWNPELVPGWHLTGNNATMALTKDNPHFATAPTSLKVTISQSAALVNEGYWGMGIRKGETFKLRTIIRASRPLTLTARLTDGNGKTLVSTPVSVSGNGWTDQTVDVTAKATCDSASLELLIPANSEVWFDYVSLFPTDTYNHQLNGMRRDVAEALARLHPAFFRWPGGCVVEGITLDNRFEWKKTLGDPAARPGQYSLWGYRCSYGMGYKEMLDFCESIGTKMMFVCNVGMDCELRLGQVCHADSVKFFLRDCLDALDYALGDSTTEWGRRRIAEGHPKPYPLQYVEVGNENWGPIYQERFALFRDAIKERYPQLTIIYNVMRKRESGIQPKTDMIDCHWYKDPAFFFGSTRMFDKWKRGNGDVYVGEYACNGNVGSGNMYAALSEAAFIGGMERNGDLVKMASYAPLFENSHDRRWRTNLIWINSGQTVGRSSYWVQRMAAENRPDYNLTTNFVPEKPKKKLVEQDFNASDESSSLSPKGRGGDTSTARGDGGETFPWETGDCPLQFVDAGYDREAGEVVLKVVNATAEPWQQAFSLDNAAIVEPRGCVITLAAKSGTDENSFEEPLKISPHETVYKRFAPSFAYTFQPFSYAILRIKAMPAIDRE